MICPIYFSLLIKKKKRLMIVLFSLLLKDQRQASKQAREDTIKLFFPKEETVSGRELPLLKYPKSSQEWGTHGHDARPRTVLPIPNRLL